MLPNAYHFYKNRSFFNTLISKILDLRSITVKIQDQESIEGETIHLEVILDAYLEKIH